MCYKKMINFALANQNFKIIMSNQTNKVTPPPTNKGVLPPTYQGVEQSQSLGGQMQELDELQALQVDRTQRITEPGYLLEIGGTPCLPLEGICAISGEAKKGKSQFLTILEAVLLSGRPFGNIRRRLQRNLKVLHVDTEQTPYDVQCNLDRLYNLANWGNNTNRLPDNFMFLRMRKLGVSDRLRMLKIAVENFNPDVIVIDGCRDLVNDFNDVNESGNIIELLMQYADQGRAIWTVLHVNEGTAKMRGHLGTELLNKCADKWNVSRVADTFQTKHVSRSKEVTALPSFRFEGTNLVPCDAVAIPENETAEQKYTRIAGEIFAEVTLLSFQDFDKQLAKRSGASLQTAQKWRKTLIEKSVISYVEDGNIEYSKPF